MVQIGSGTTATADLVDLGSSLTALYAIDITTARVDERTTTTGAYLVSIAPGTGVVTEIGSLGLTGSQLTGITATRITGDTQADADFGLSTGSNTLYFADGNTLYTLDTTTGAAVSDGTISIAGLHIGALVVDDGTLYAGANTYVGHTTHKALYSLTLNTDPTSVTAKFISEVTPNTPTVAFLGLAKVIPEPSAWGLMLFGVGAVGGALRSRRRGVRTAI
ncbi:MAG: PEPxxWA-CTERM sorting domain-containing protein [Caulobacteraceae bacterium]